jgi:hypothetical protein
MERESLAGITTRSGLAVPGGRRTIGVLTLSLLAVACGADARPAAWEYISPVIIQPNCATASCHSRAAAVAGLDFSDPERGYVSLTGLKVWVVDPQGSAGCMRWGGTTVVCQRNFRPLVTPYNPEQSRLVNMIRARSASRMPPDRPLHEADVELIEKWIRNGAFYRQPAADGTGDAGPTVSVTVTTGGADAGLEPVGAER